MTEFAERFLADISPDPDPDPAPPTARDAVIAHAEAVVGMEREIADLRREYERLARRAAERRDSLTAGERERRKLVDRLHAVKVLHGEAQEPACGDGCCHEGLGYCGFCGEGVPFPCRTYRVADGKDEE